jgi:hypothetical protein
MLTAALLNNKPITIAEKERNMLTRTCFSQAQ